MTGLKRLKEETHKRAHELERSAEIGQTTIYGHVITEHDWPEDFSSENGNYECKCIFCGKTFVGYKRRLTCRARALKI